jgi:hypothetical protein
MKKVRFTEVMHQWLGTAIVRTEEGLKEVPLGVMHTDKKLKETGAKELFTNIPTGTITVEAKKNCDVITTYEADVNKFKTIAQVVETPTEQAEGEAIEQ